MIKGVSLGSSDVLNRVSQHLGLEMTLGKHTHTHYERVLIVCYKNDFKHADAHSHLSKPQICMQMNNH